MKLNHPKLPSKDNDIDWDVICEDYHSYILSPFALEMINKDDDGKSRNLLLNYIETIPAVELKKMNVLDVGCGPGNLIPYLVGKINLLVGVDISKESLRIAEQLATSSANIDFVPHCINILDFEVTNKFDLIISSNSILPSSRKEVFNLFRKIRECLTPTGIFLAILPSFDTILYLKSLWENQGNNQVSQTFITEKLMNEKELAYADDGHHSQCYHTKDSIKIELGTSGLQLTQEPKKVYYPWELTHKFDYGYFPHAKEEIWDWFIVAKRHTK